jgi:hypothetical protein
LLALNAVSPGLAQDYFSGKEINLYVATPKDMVAKAALASRGG